MTTNAAHACVCARQVSSALGFHDVTSLTAKTNRLSVFEGAIASESASSDENNHNTKKYQEGAPRTWVI